MKKKKDKIVFLDAGTVDYGDVSFKEIEALGEFQSFFRTEYSEIENRVQTARIVITNKCRLDRAILSRIKTVQCISVVATGVNNIDLKAAKENGIRVTNVSGYSTETVVQCTFAFLLELAGNLIPFNQSAHDGRWSRSPFFMLSDYPVREISGKILGIVGYGAIGKRVAEIARCFGMKVLISKIPGRKYPAKDSVKRIDFEKVIRHSDFLTIHAPLSDLTRDLINGTVLRKMKRGAFLINMARGGIVNEGALRKALEDRHLAGAACDVLTVEPPPTDHVLLNAPNLLMTPHIAWASREARTRLVHEMALNIKAFQQGKARNRVV